MEKDNAIQCSESIILKLAEVLCRVVRCLITILHGHIFFTINMIEINRQLHRSTHNDELKQQPPTNIYNYKLMVFSTNILMITSKCVSMCMKNYGHWLLETQVLSQEFTFPVKK